MCSGIDYGVAEAKIPILLFKKPAICLLLFHILYIVPKQMFVLMQQPSALVFLSLDLCFNE